MNMIETQAAGLPEFLSGLTPPPVEHDRDVMRNNHIIEALRAAQPHMQALGDALNRHDIPDVPKMIVDAQRKSNRLSRLEELAELAGGIGNASLLECKLIINELIDRVSTLTGCASELEDASCAIGRELDSRDADDYYG